MSVRVSDNLNIIARLDARGVQQGVRITEAELGRVHNKTQAMNDAFGQMVPIMRSVAGVFGIAFGIGAVRQITQFADESARLAAQLGITEKAFQRLAAAAGRDAVMELEKLRSAVGGTLSDLELMQKVGAAVDAGMTFEQSRTALEYLRRYSLAYGKDFNQLVSTIFTGLQRGSVLMLDDAGIIMSATSEMYEGMGDLEKKSALVGEAIRQMNEKMEVLPAITDNAITATDRLASAWENFRIQVGQAITPVSAMGTVLATDFLNALSFNAEKMQELRKLVDDIRREAERATQGTDQSLRRLVQEDIAKEGWREDEATRLAGSQAYHKRVGSDDETFHREHSRLQEELIQARIEEKKQIDEWQKSYNQVKLTAKDVTDEVLLQYQRMKDGGEDLSEFFKKFPGATPEFFSALNMIRRPEVGLDLAFDGPDIIDGNRKSEKEPGLPSDAIDQQLMRERIELVNELTRNEFQATEDRVGLAKWEADQWAASMRSRVVLTESGSDELLRIEQVRLAMIGQAEKAEEERKKAKAEEEKKKADKEAREKEETRIRRILLIFDADASAVTDSADLARYSLGLFVDGLRQVSPALSTVVDGIHQITAGGLSNLKEGQSFNLSGGVAAGIGFAVNTGLQMIAADSAKWRAEAARLNKELADARDITGQYARNLEAVNIAQQKQMFEDLIGGLPERLGGIWAKQDWAKLVDLTDFSVHVGDGFDAALSEIARVSNLTMQKSWTEAQRATVESAFAQLERLGEGIRRFSGEAFSFGQAMDDINHLMRLEGVTDPAQRLQMLREGLAGFIDIAAGLESDFSSLSLQDQRQLKETIADLQRSIAQTEIEAREEQARTVIQSIQRQHVEVQRAMDDAQEAQRQALLRSVKLRFDLEETALRATFLPRLIGAGADTLESERVWGEMRREIELLRLQEQAAGTTELARLREAFNAEAELQRQATDLLVQAVTDAAQVTDMAFRDAVEVQTHELLAGFASELSGTVLGKPIAPADLVDMRSQVLLDMGTLLAPVGVAPVNLASALRPFGVADVDLRDALALQGVKFVNIGQFFEPTGVRIVELSTALGLSGQQTVDLVQALRLSGQVDVSMPDALSVSGKRVVQASNVIDITGRLDVPANQVLAMTGVSTQMDTQIAQLRDIRTFTWAANEHLWALRQAGIGGGSGAVNVDLSTTNQWLREIAQINAAMVQLQFAQRSVRSDFDLDTLGGFAGFNALASLIGRNLPSYDVGGVVPGPVGRPQLAVVHGGETIYRPGEGRAVHVNLDSLIGNININTNGGAGANELRRTFDKEILPQIRNSLRDGTLGREIEQMIRRAVQRSA